MALKCDVRASTPVGSQFWWGVPDSAEQVFAYGASSGQRVAVTELASHGPLISVIAPSITTPIPTALVPLPTYTLDNGQRSLLRFKVTAGDGGLSLSKFSIKIATTTVTLSGITAWIYTDSGFSDIDLLHPDLVWISNTNQIDVDISPSNANSYVIPANQTRYFDITASVRGRAFGSSISTQLVGVDGTNITDNKSQVLSAFVDSYNTVAMKNMEDQLASIASIVSQLTKEFLKK